MITSEFTGLVSGWLLINPHIATLKIVSTRTACPGRKQQEKS
jgi:hypothetical protein